ncbi:RbsD/FucU family protein [Pseudonocardia sp. CA-107938]|uniref:RbsD/FucU family protein n=1 Tax=Pseudonocardia sp. CA-107938 TaxID=3240021 RepID=UPI003D8E96C0
MLTGIDPLLVGPLLAHLDAMGHSDAVVLADAHFPAARVATRLLELPAVGTPALLAAICTVLPLDDAPALDLMDTPDHTRLPVQDELIAATGGAEPRMLDRFAFYTEAQGAFLVVRTGETRTYGNALVRKGVVHA